MGGGWIMLDSWGSEKSVLDVDKHAIMQRFHIHARDLRVLDPLLSYPSTILARDNAILLNLEHIKAIITAQEVLLRDPLDDNIIPVVEELRRRLPSLNITPQDHGEEKESSVQNDGEAGGDTTEPPFEFRALEVALQAICSFLAARTNELEISAYPALDELTSKISIHNLDKVRKLKSGMTSLTARVQKVRDELEQLLDEENDLADLYLSRKLSRASLLSGSVGASLYISSPHISSKISRASRASMESIQGDETNVEELEMLLEAYFMQIDGTLNKLTMVREYIDDTEDYINIQLELFLSLGTLCFAVYSLVAGIFGMNIKYTWNDDHGYIFKWVVILSGIGSAVLFLLVISYARFKGVLSDLELYQPAEDIKMNKIQ
uniref:Magnesium transporter n=1 Tax=Daucus carota subsp. sativus TaxID=79200 RepID=A0A161XQC6_DAUCS